MARRGRKRSNYERHALRAERALRRGSKKTAKLHERKALRRMRRQDDRGGTWEVYFRKLAKKVEKAIS